MTTPCRFDASVSLPALLSRCLVAFTIEVDDELEHRMPHRTGRYGRTPGAGPRPYLTSMAMWTSCLRHLDEAGVSVEELERRSRLVTNLAGMERWGYVTVAPSPSDPRPRPPRRSWLVRPTPGGVMARAAWDPLPAIVEQRWVERLDGGAVARLREALARIADGLDPSLPDGLPILGPGLFGRLPRPGAAAPADPPTGSGRPTGADRPIVDRPAAADRPTAATLPLWALLSRPLLALALEVEATTGISMAIGSDILRRLGEEPTPVGDLPRRAGVSREAVAMALTELVRRRHAVVEVGAPGRRGRTVRLTATGLARRGAHEAAVAAVEAAWSSRFGTEAVEELRSRLVAVAGSTPVPSAALRQAIEPYPDGWRTQVRPPAVLPDYPMVLHRGGFPDGA